MKSAPTKSPPTQPTRSPKLILGNWGETIASQYLEQAGYQIVARNLHSKLGELDIVARSPKARRSQGAISSPGTTTPQSATTRQSVTNNLGATNHHPGTVKGLITHHSATNQQGTLVFVEVKTRRGTRYGLGREAITAEKQRHLIRAAQLYLQRARQLNKPWQIDVIEIQMDSTGELISIAHLVNVVGG